MCFGHEYGIKRKFPTLSTHYLHFIKWKREIKIRKRKQKLTTTQIKFITFLLFFVCHTIPFELTFCCYCCLATFHQLFLFVFVVIILFRFSHRYDVYIFCKQSITATTFYVIIILTIKYVCTKFTDFYIYHKKIIKMSFLLSVFFCFFFSFSLCLWSSFFYFCVLAFGNMHEKMLLFKIK